MLPHGTYLCLPSRPCDSSGSSSCSLSLFWDPALVCFRAGRLSQLDVRSCLLLLQGRGQGFACCPGRMAWVWWEGKGRALGCAQESWRNLHWVLPRPVTGQRWPRCFTGATTTTKDWFGVRRVGTKPGWCSAAFSSSSVTSSAQGAQRHHAEGALAFCP